ncbi:hypothetical protein M8818_002338 [Zalaria obscura]|uniref:Uncharacterized protein n=1 Tax=Zalaria obscura TaxID=2024903 RepID=A0ACC3SII4_9PEZI
MAVDAIWRDFLSMTGYLRTINSSRSIAVAFRELKEEAKPHDFKSTPDSCEIAQFGPQTAWINAGFTFKTYGKLEGNCSGIVSMIPDTEQPGEWKIWMLRTWLENFEGCGHPDVLDPVSHLSNGHPTANGVPNGDSNGTGSRTYGAVIVGGSQGGLACAGRLKALGVSYILLERNEQIGDTWANRYETLKWHLPFDRTYLPEEDYLLPARHIGAGHKRWAERFDINMRLNTTVEKATWDTSSGVWDISVASPSGSCALKAQNLVLCIGAGSSIPVTPSWPGRERYKGSAFHSVEYRSAEPWRGKRGIVIGTANTAHDVAEDMVNAGFSSVTMVQRGKTFVFPAEVLHHAQNILYNTNIPTATADRLSSTFPNKIVREFTNRAVFRAADEMAAYFDALEAAGFRLDRKGDIYDNLYVRFGGHYVDVGTSARIAKGEIKMKTEAVKEWTEHGLRFDDGSEVEADLIVLCTGFEHDFRASAREILGDVADQVDEFWGLDAEGEIRGAFKPAGHPRLYYHGGDVRMSRWYSRFVALQVQADVLGKPLEPYLETP